MKKIFYGFMFFLTMAWAGTGALLFLSAAKDGLNILANKMMLLADATQKLSNSLGFYNPTRTWLEAGFIAGTSALTCLYIIIILCKKAKKDKEK